MERVNLVLRLPKNIHSQLTIESKKYSMSINTLIIHKLSGLQLQKEKSVKQ